jgi:hypothetical protein
MLVEGDKCLERCRVTGSLRLQFVLKISGRCRGRGGGDGGRVVRHMLGEQHSARLRMGGREKG